MPLKSDILSNTEQNSILRSELHDIEVYLDQTAIQLYALEEQINAQAKNIQGLTTQKKEYESKNKLQNDKEVVGEKEGLGLGKSLTVFTLTTLKGIKDSITGWRAGFGF